jgi:hypothetical protein
MLSAENNNTTIMQMIRRLLQESDIEAFEAILPIVTDWVQVEHETQTRLFLTDETGTSDSGQSLFERDEGESSDDHEHKTESCYPQVGNALNQTTKNPFTLTSILKICGYALTKRTRIFNRIVADLEGLGESHKIQATRGHRNKQSEIIFADAATFLLAFQSLRNKMANKIKVLQAKIAGYVMTRIAAAQLAMIRAKDEEIEQLTVDFDRVTTERDAVTTERDAVTAENRTLVQTPFVLLKTTLDLEPTYLRGGTPRNADARLIRQQMDSWRGRGMIRSEKDRYNKHKRYVFTSAFNVRIAEAEVNNLRRQRARGSGGIKNYFNRRK